MVIAGPNLTIDRTAGDRRAAPGRGAALRPRRGDAGRQGRSTSRERRGRSAHSALLVVVRCRATPAAPAAALIAEEGVELRGVPCGGELRSTLVVQERGGRTTVFNEPGPPVDERRWERLRERGARRG